jgi:hypothetical protein
VGQGWGEVEGFALFDEDGEQIAHCKLAERSLTCKKD